MLFTTHIPLLLGLLLRYCYSISYSYSICCKRMIALLFLATGCSLYHLHALLLRLFPPFVRDNRESTQLTRDRWAVVFITLKKRFTKVMAILGSMASSWSMICPIVVANVITLARALASNFVQYSFVAQKRPQGTNGAEPSSLVSHFMQSSSRARRVTWLCRSRLRLVGMFRQPTQLTKCRRCFLIKACPRSESWLT